jgi:hypothetical protein
MSLRIWRSCSSRRFRSSFIRGIVSFSSVLLFPASTKSTSRLETKRTGNRELPPHGTGRERVPLGAAEAAAAAALAEEGVQHRHNRSVRVEGEGSGCLAGEFNSIYFFDLKWQQQKKSPTASVRVRVA